MGREAEGAGEDSKQVSGLRAGGTVEQFTAIRDKGQEQVSRAGDEHIFNTLNLRWPWDSRWTEGPKLRREVWTGGEDWDT